MKRPIYFGWDAELQLAPSGLLAVNDVSLVWFLSLACFSASYLYSASTIELFLCHILCQYGRNSSIHDIHPFLSYTIHWLDEQYCPWYEVMPLKLLFFVLALWKIQYLQPTVLLTLHTIALQVTNLFKPNTTVMPIYQAKKSSLTFIQLWTIMCFDLDT